MPRSHLQIPIFIALLAICAVAAFMFHRAGQKGRDVAAPDISGLKETLTRTAEQSLPAPSLSDASLRIPYKEGDVQTQASRIVLLAERLGGDAVQVSSEGGTAKILARLPPANLSKFRDSALSGSSAPLPEPVQSDPSVSRVLIEVNVGP